MPLEVDQPGERGPKSAAAAAAAANINSEAVQMHGQQQPCDMLAASTAAAVESAGGKDAQLAEEKSISELPTVCEHQPKTQNHVISQQQQLGDDSATLDAARLLLAQQHQAAAPNSSVAASTNINGQQQQWLAQVAAQTQLGVRQRMSLAGDQFGHSLRQLYASASSIAADVHPPAYHNIPGVVPFYHGHSIGPPPSYDDVINPYAPPPAYQSLFGQMREARKTSRGILDLLRRLLIIVVSMLGCTILIFFMILIPFTMIIVGAVYMDECRIEHIPAFLLVGGLVWASKNIVHCYAQCRQMPPTSSSSSDGERAGHQDDDQALGPNLNDNNSSPHSSLGDGGESDSSDASPPPSFTGEALAASGGLERNLHLAAPEAGRHRRHNRRRRRHSPTARYSTPAHRNQQNYNSGRRLKSSICESLLNCVLFGWFIAGCVIVFRNYEPDFGDPTSLRYCHRTVYMYTFWLISSAILLLGLFVGCVCCLMVSSAIATRQDDIDLV